MLTLLDRTGGLHAPDAGPEQSIDDPEDRAVARQAAAESFVLLQNHGAVLPIAAVAADAPPVLAVIGPNASVAMIQGGGSARVSQFPPVTPLAGLQERFGDAFTVEHERGCSSFKQTPVLDTTVLDGPLQVAYFAGRERSGEPVLVEPGDRAWFTFTGPFTPGGAGRVLDADLGHARRARDRARGRSASCRSAGRACPSTVRSSSTTGSPPVAARRSWASRAPR